MAFFAAPGVGPTLPGVGPKLPAAECAWTAPASAGFGSNAGSHSNSTARGGGAAADDFDAIDAGVHGFFQQPPPGWRDRASNSNSGGGSLLQAPSAEVQYDAVGDVPTAGAQLAAEKAALKRQLRQLDADFEVTVFCQFSGAVTPGTAGTATLQPATSHPRRGVPNLRASRTQVRRLHTASFLQRGAEHACPCR